LYNGHIEKQQRQLILASFGVGWVYALLVGMVGLSSFAGLQITVMGLIFIGALWFFLRWRKEILPRYQLGLFVSVGILLFFLSITTNPILVPLTKLAVLMVLGLSTSAIYCHQRLPSSLGETLLSILDLLSNYLRQVMVMVNLKNYWGGLKGNQIRWPKIKIKGTIFVLGILLVINILFARINGDYADFLVNVVQNLWQVLRFILDIDIIWITLKGLFNGYLFYVFYQTVFLGEPATPVGELRKLGVMDYLRLTIVLVVICFGLFSGFQSRLLFGNFRQMSFFNLSIYTQKGFWELLAVSVIGYLLFIYTTNRVEKKILLGRTYLVWLAIFLTELLLMCVYSYHKLFLLQIYFGLKDQRILATVAVSLIAMTFVLSAFRLRGKIKSTTVFYTQIVAFVMVMVFLNTINLDLWVTQHNPIGYYVDGKRQKDYAYLLTNSFDNYASWPNLWQEVVSGELKLPEEKYYWGWYKSLCDYPLDTVEASPLEKRFDYLFQKYSPTVNSSLTQTMQFNWHEYQAYLVFRNEKDLYRDFQKKVATTCLVDIVVKSP